VDTDYLEPDKLKIKVVIRCGIAEKFLGEEINIIDLFIAVKRLVKRTADIFTGSAALATLSRKIFF